MPPLIFKDPMRYDKGAAAVFFMKLACCLTIIDVLSPACFVPLVFKVESVDSCFSDVLALLTMARLDNLAGRDGSWGITAIVRAWVQESGQPRLMVS